jgi:hypothetical protein
MLKICLPVAASVVLHAAILALYLAAFHGDPSALVCADKDSIGEPPYEAITIGFPSGGFDGQFYYVVAQNPWQRQERGMDLGCYRQLRILYPALGWALSGGDPRLLLWVLPAINLVVIGVMAWLGLCLARHFGMNVWWGFLLPLAVNDGMMLLRNLTDPLGMLAVCGLVAGWLLNWRGWTLSLWAVVAVLSREQNVAVVGVVLLALLWVRRWRSAAGLACALALWAGWIGILRIAYGQWPFLPHHPMYYGSPFSGFLFRWTHLTQASSTLSAIFHFLRILVLTAQIVLGSWLAARSSDGVIAAVILGGTAMAVLAGIAFYEDAWGYTRVFGWIPLGIWLASVRLRQCRPMWVLTPAILWPLITVATAWHSWRT